MKKPAYLTFYFQLLFPENLQSQVRVLCFPSGVGGGGPGSAHNQQVQQSGGAHAGECSTETVGFPLSSKLISSSHTFLSESFTSPLLSFLLKSFLVSFFRVSSFPLMSHLFHLSSPHVLISPPPLALLFCRLDLSDSLFSLLSLHLSSSLSPHFFIQ